jgi:hypothetical protein
MVALKTMFLLQRGETEVFCRVDFLRVGAESKPFREAAEMR